MFKLEEHLQSLYPESLKIVENVDIGIAKDIERCSQAKPLLIWEPDHRFEHLNYMLAFPDTYDSMRLVTAQI